MAGNSQLSCVRNLAIDMSAWIKGPREEVTFSPPFEKYMVLILQTFGHIERLTLTAEFLEPLDNYPGHNLSDIPKCRESLTFLDATDFEVALEGLKGIGSASCMKMFQATYKSSQDQDDDMSWWREIDRKRLNYWRKRLMKATPDRPVWKLPTIRWKFALSRHQKEKFKAAKRKARRDSKMKFDFGTLSN